MKGNYLSQFFVFLSVACLALTLNSINYYMQVQATVGPSLTQLNDLDSASLQAMGIDPAQVESTKTQIAGIQNSALQSILLNFVFGIVFFLGGYLTHKDR